MLKKYASKQPGFNFWSDEKLIAAFESDGFFKQSGRLQEFYKCVNQAIAAPTLTLSTSHLTVIGSVVTTEPIPSSNPSLRRFRSQILPCVDLRILNSLNNSQTEWEQNSRPKILVARQIFVSHLCDSGRIACGLNADVIVAGQRDTAVHGLLKRFKQKWQPMGKTDTAFLDVGLLDLCLQTETHP